jgi:hypothetical protein
MHQKKMQHVIKQETQQYQLSNMSGVGMVHRIAHTSDSKWSDLKWNDPKQSDFEQSDFKWSDPERSLK